MTVRKRLGGALLALVLAYGVLVAVMIVVALTFDQTRALGLASYSFPISLASLAIGWFKPHFFLWPFRRR